MMKAETKAKWLEALRSGEYMQVTSVLNDGNGGFCCLGVLHEITGGQWHKNSDGKLCTGSKKRKNSDSEMLDGPIFLQGLDRYIAAGFAELNDDGKTFEEIAEEIEEKVETK